MTTAAEYAALAATEANLAATAAVEVQNKVAIAESSANLATTHAATVGASVTGAAASSSAAAIQAIVAENYRDLAQLWANADPNVVVEGTAFSARHQAPRIGTWRKAKSFRAAHRTTTSKAARHLWSWTARLHCPPHGRSRSTGNRNTTRAISTETACLLRSCALL
jgi:hypothetical protein